MQICVYCASSAQIHPEYFKATEELAHIFAKNKVQVVFGGGSSGLMGQLADGVLAAGGQIKGIMPQFMNEVEWGHRGVSDFIYTETMHERKALMEKLCDGIITLPGGYGSMDELFEILSWSQLGLHQKPIGLLNLNGFYDHLLKQLDVMVEEGFLKAENRNLVIESDNIEDLMEKMSNFKASFHEKWLKREQI
jgi:uncharacterized protein (TIGR00730 family)